MTRRVACGRSPRRAGKLGRPSSCRESIVSFESSWAEQIDEGDVHQVAVTESNGETWMAELLWHLLKMEPEVHSNC